MKKILSVLEKLGWQAGWRGDADRPLSASSGRTADFRQRPLSKELRPIGIDVPS
jgi:hypothetical protein